MDAKIQKLTEKLYLEGVEKGNRESERILSEAKAQADAMLKEAQEKASAIVADATKKAADEKKHTQAELKLFTVQAMEALKSEIADLITEKVVSEAVKPVVEDKKMMHEFILKLAETWAASDLPTIQTADAESLTAYFVSNAKALLDKGLKIEKVNGRPASFTILPSDGSYKITFGEEEFRAYFKEFLRPQLIDILF